MRKPRTVGGTWAYRLDAAVGAGQERRQVQVAGFATQDAAAAALADALAAQDVVRPVGLTADTVAGFLTGRWVRMLRHEVAESAFVNYQRIVSTYVIPRVGQLRLSKLTTAVVEEMDAGLLATGRRDGGELSATTVGQVHRTLRRALNDAVRCGLIQSNPASGARAPKAPGSRLLDVWTPAQTTQFLQVTGDDRLGGVVVGGVAHGAATRRTRRVTVA